MKTIGSLFSGYGGLDMGVQLALGPMRTAWVSDIEPGPQAILAQRFPDAPNLGDITEVDWSQVEPVDVLTGGSPCQDLSMAGQRAGMKPGTRSGLWESMAHAIDQLRPSLVIWENVRGAYSAEAFSLCDVEQGAGCLGDGSGRSSLRALGRVLGDLANLGYDAGWHSIRAADVGAPHNRARVFVVAHPHSVGLQRWRTLGPHSRHTSAKSGHLLLPTPTSSDRNGPGKHGDGGLDLRTTVALLPTPKAADGEWGLPRTSGRPPEKSTHLATRLEYTNWGDYGLAISRWKTVLGRPAPPPTNDGKLSPAFVEWMMGLPAGWVTDVPISRAQQLRALGNGVVPQQAAAAISGMLAWNVEVAA